MNELSPLELLKVAEVAAEAGAAILREAYDRMRSDKAPDLRIRHKSSVMDPVTAIDVAAQEKIVSVIRQHFPDHRFLAEEEGVENLGNPQSPYTWIIDPLDGTLNFIHGKENFGSIVAVMKDDEILAGCMVLPIVNLRFTGTKGGGAMINGKPVTLRKTKDLTDAIICSNITRRASERDGVLHVTLPVCASVHNYGCAAREIGEVLLGGNDGALFHGIKIWDVAAGLLMLSEAGGRYRYEWLDPSDRRKGIACVASTAPVFDDLCAFLFKK